MKNQYPYLLLLCIGLAISSCKCKDDDKPCTDPTNPKCENYDPCYGKKATAEFTIEQWFGWYNNEFKVPAEICDTIVTSSALFKAKMKSATSYSWQIGTDDREFNQKEFNMSFASYMQDIGNINTNDPNIYKPITITLTVRNNKGECVDTKDTFLQHTRNIVFVRTKYAFIPFGKFKGKTDEDNVDRIVEIVRYDDSSFQSSHVARIAFINFPNLENKDSLISVGAGPPLSPKLLSSYRYYWWDSGHDDYLSEWSFNNKALNDGLNMGKITKHHQPPNNLYIEFEYKHVTKDGRVKTYQFKGNKIE